MSSKQPSDMTILVVDDEEDVRYFLADILEDAGFEVMTACDGVEALAKVKEKQPDLVSLDLVMPNKSGIRFLHDLRREPRWKDIPVVIVTAHAHDDLGGKDFQDIFGSRSLSGPKVYLEKPVKPGSYAQLVCESLGIECADGDGATPNAEGEAGDLRAELERLMNRADAGELAEAIRLLKSKK